MRKIKRDIVISSTDKGDLVGVYFADTDGSEVLLECSPERADLIIKLWNNVIDPVCERCGIMIKDDIIMLDHECAVDERIIDKY